MAAGEARLAYGIALEYSANGSAPWTELEDIDEMSEPGNPEAAEVDVTPLRDTTTNVRRYRLGLYKGGEFSFSQFFKASRYTALVAVRNATFTADYYFRISPPDAATVDNCSHFVFGGRVKKLTLKGTGDADDALTIQVTVTVNTDITFTAAV